MGLVFDPELTYDQGLTYYPLVFGIPAFIYAFTLTGWFLNYWTFRKFALDVQPFLLVGGLLFAKLLEAMIAFMTVVLLELKESEGTVGLMLSTLSLLFSTTYLYFFFTLLTKGLGITRVIIPPPERQTAVLLGVSMMVVEVISLLFTYMLLIRLFAYQIDSNVAFLAHHIILFAANPRTPAAFIRAFRLKIGMFVSLRRLIVVFLTMLVTVKLSKFVIYPFWTSVAESLVEVCMVLGLSWILRIQEQERLVVRILPNGTLAIETSAANSAERIDVPEQRQEEVIEMVRFVIQKPQPEFDLNYIVLLPKLEKDKQVDDSGGFGAMLLASADVSDL